jgi:anti-sigma B factor antagonist
MSSPGADRRKRRRGLMTRSPVMVKQFPKSTVSNNSTNLFQDVETLLRCDRPSLVFDFSNVSHFDSAGIDMLLRCLQEAMKRNGDIKLAAVPPSVAVIIELTRVDRLFQIFVKPSDAVESFHSFPVEATVQSMAPGFSWSSDKGNPLLHSSPFQLRPNASLASCRLSPGRLNLPCRRRGRRLAPKTVLTG